MVQFNIPPKENERLQLVVSVVVILLVAVVAAILSKILVGFIIFLLGVIFGVGAKVIDTNPLDKDK